MATPLGHSLAGYAVASRSGTFDGRSSYFLIILCVFMANAPDLDFLPGIVAGHPALFHQGITHSVLFGCIVSLGAAVVCAYGGWPFLRIFYLCLFSYLSHLVMDFFGPDGRPPYGIPLLWPMSDTYFISPVPLFLGMHHAGSAQASVQDWIRGVLDFRNLGAVALEVVLIAPFVFLGMRRGETRQRIGESIEKV
jgi:inner membrane protein